MAVPYTETRFEGAPEEVNAQWVENRKHGIGGSDVATIMGLNRFSSPYEVWLIKTGRDDGPDLDGNQAVEWGNRLEDIVAAKFAELHPELRVTRRNATLVSKERPWAFANIDRQLSDGKGGLGVLEVKTVGSRRAHDWDEGVPVYYLTQVTHYLAVTGWEYAWVAVLIGGQEYREYRIERDEEDIRAVSERVDVFWQAFVEQDVPPALIGTAGEAQGILAQHEQPGDEYLPMMDEDVPQLDELERVNAELDELKRRKTLLESEVKDAIGDARGIDTPTRRITWVRSSRSSFDRKAFEADHPGLMDGYRKTTVTNGGLRVSLKKEE